MSLSDLSSLATVIGSMAVLISLIYLSLQIRQNTKHTRAIILQGRVERVVNQHLAISNSELVTAWIVGNGGTPTPEEIWRRQFWLQGLAYDLSWEDTYSQYEAGLLGEEQFADFRAHVVVLLRKLGLHRYFSERPIPKGGPTRFQRFINELLSESATPAAPRKGPGDACPS